MRFYIHHLQNTTGVWDAIEFLDPWVGCDLYNCAVCGVRGLKHARRDLGVEVRKIAKLDDIEQVFSTKVCSKKFRDATEQAGLTGIEYRPFKVVQPRFPNKPDLVRFAQWFEEEYRAIWVYGSGGKLAKECEVKVARQCEVCGWVSYTLPKEAVIVDESQWDGSDFFQMVDYPGPTIMTERAFDVLRTSGLTNFCAEPADEFWPDDFKKLRRDRGEL